MNKGLISKSVFVLSVLLSLLLSPGSRAAELGIQKNADELVLTWTSSGMVLQSAPAVSGTYTNLTGATNPHSIPITGDQRFFRLMATNLSPAGMVLIPDGSFTMGNTFAGEGEGDELPLHTVQVSAFYLDQHEVTKVLWDDVFQWATNNGYSFEFADSGQGKATNHPAHSLTWHDAVKWCNARSERENRLPAYYTDAGLTLPYKLGQVAPFVNWQAGYRLPTEAEWEKAARGGKSGHRFPWDDTDDITHSRANYYSLTNYVYDTSPTRESHPAFAVGGEPYTSPVGHFPANDYGLHDMAGNVWEWTWDWYSIYSAGAQADPRGPASGSFRIPRGGSWTSHAPFCRVTYRGSLSPTGRYYDIGFRCALPASP